MDNSYVWRKRNHQRQGKLKITTSTFLLLSQCLVKVAEKLQDTLLSSAVPGCRMLDSETVNTAIVAADLQSPVRACD